MNFLYSVIFSSLTKFLNNNFFNKFKQYKAIFIVCCYVFQSVCIVWRNMPYTYMRLLADGHLMVRLSSNKQRQGKLTGRIIPLTSFVGTCVYRYTLSLLFLAFTTEKTYATTCFFNITILNSYLHE